MAKGEKDVPELVRAAQSLESELANLEALSKSTRKVQLNSDRSIARAAKELTGALALQDRIAEGLATLAAAIAHLQSRQEAALAPLATFATDIQQRMQRLGEHMQAFAALGASASEVTTLIQSANGDHSAIVGSVGTQLAEISEAARALCEAARADDFPDLAREAEALKQRTAALRKRMEN